MDIWTGPNPEESTEEDSENISLQWKDWKERLVGTEKNADAFAPKLLRLACTYWEKRIHKAARLCRTGALSQMLLPKTREQADGHHSILVKGKTDEWRRCETTEEILKGAVQYQSRWMQKSKTKRECHYPSIKEDEVGPCGALIEPDRPFMEDSIMSEDER